MYFNNFYNTQSIKRIYFPTKVFTGIESRSLIFNILPKNSVAILVVDKYFIKDPYLNKIEEHLNINRKIIVNSEPDTSLIDKSINDLPYNISSIIGIGGGSTIDTAKAIAAKIKYGEYRRIGYEKFRDVSLDIEKNDPVIIAIPTTAGTGSEVSRYYLIKDIITKEKLVSRSWRIVPNYAILDPYFLSSSPIKTIILCAFDAFIHLWETFICQYERSNFTDMLAFEGIPQILRCMEKLDRKERLIDTEILKLQYSAMLGGVALSNVRTGIMHGAGEALSAQVALSHPETLYIFFEESIKQYSGVIEDRALLLLNVLNVKSLIKEYNSINDIIALWKSLFNKYNIEENIKEKIKYTEINLNKITDIIIKDKVLMDKESPIRLTRRLIQDFVKSSLITYTFKDKTIKI